MKVGDVVWHNEDEIIGVITEMVNPFVAMILWADCDMDLELICNLREL